MSFKKINLFLFVVLANILLSCSLFDEDAVRKSQVGSDNEPIIHIVMLDVPKLTSSADWVYCEGTQVDINNFLNVDSIVFGTLLRSQESTESGIVELYDFNKERSVLNSRVESNVRYILNYVESGDILSTFPQDPTLLGIRVKSSREGHFVEVGSGTELIIYSH